MVHRILIDALEVAGELLILPEMLLQPQQLVKYDLHGQRAVLVELLVHQEYRVAPTYPLEEADGPQEACIEGVKLLRLGEELLEGAAVIQVLQDCSEIGQL